MIAPFDNRLLDKYEIIHEIKRGGFGIVYYGLDKRLNKPIAIKKIVPNLAGEDNFLDMFHDEALNVARLNHNNIVHIYDLKKTIEGHLYIIMEFIDGYDLERVIRLCRKFQLKFPPELAAHVVAETCVALDYANQRRDALTNKPLNLVHQDVSPSNIMVSRMGSVKLIDFGISSVKLHQKTEKKSNKLRGKIPYMAPEQMIRGSVPDHRSDIFSLGLVLYEILAGERIFNSREDVYGAGKNPKAFRKACDVSTFPKKLGQTITRALDIDITRRYQRASDMHVDLIDYLSSRNGSGEFNDALATFVSQELDKRKRRPVSTPTPGDALTNSGDTTAKSSPHYSATSKWYELEIIEDSPKNQRQPQPRINTPLVNTKRITKETLFTTEPASQESDYIKNIIDIIGETAKENKHRIIQFCAGLLVLAILLGVLNILTGWTQAGAWVHDIFFQQTLAIETIPSNAQILLNEKQIQGLSPINLADIPPGNHKLELRLDGYKPLVRTISVQPDGSIDIKGLNEQDGQRFLFRFNTEIQIDSDPQGAFVIVNGAPIDQRTPCTIPWKVGQPFSLELAHTGFQKLGGFALDTVTNSAEVENPEFWRFKILKEKESKYTINATFKKNIVFNTTPRDVQIFDLDTNQKLNDDGSNRILLSAGLHNLELRRAGLLPKRLQLNITKDTDSELTVVLERNVLFTATDRTNGADIGADLISLKNGNREFLRTSYRTPVELKLPAYSYTAVFAKPGYGRRQATFGPDNQKVSVVLSAASAILEVEILDALSGQPIEGADILYHVGENPANSWTLLEKSDSRGKGAGELKAGKYVIAVNRAGFRSMTRSIIARAGESQIVRFKIYPSS